ncbi:MAG: YIP1 family protein [Chthoniobacterales bacterium]|nr:YIP1 family protein [Chthoniobacterales bacterium]
MKIHLNRAGQSLGQFTPEDVRAGFSEGKFTGTDLAWCDGMPMWKPLAEVIDEIAPGSPDESPAAAPAAVTPVAGSGFPWEQRAQRGFFNALLETIRFVLLEPSKVFAGMPPAGGLGAPLFFFVLCATVGGVAGLAYQVILNAVSPGSGTPEQQALANALASTAVLGSTIMVLPFFFAALVFVSAGLTHLALIIVGGAKKSFEATFRVTCYAGGATAVLNLLPVCGALAAWIWNIIVMVFGLSEVHGISRGRALAAVLLPTLLCCALMFGALMLVATAAGGALGLLNAAGK